MHSFKTFNELWEACEQLHQEYAKEDNISLLLDKLIMQLNLYKAVDLKSEIPNADCQKIKSHLMGEILLTITNLSLKDNINVFDSLFEVYQEQSIDLYSSKYED